MSFASRFVKKAVVVGEQLEEKPIDNPNGSSSDSSSISKPDQEYDPRTLYERLQANKLKKEEEFAEKTKLGNLIKKLDEGQ
jgi:hypothetical protein